LAGWDNSILAIELQHLINLDDFDVAVVGFDVPEIDMILGEAGPEPDKDDVVDVDETATAVSEPGDLWQLGEHRVLCGSALQAESFAFLMAGQRADVVFVDPPYNVVIATFARTAFRQYTYQCSVISVLPPGIRDWAVSSSG
jgi:hypothetical protein